MASLNSVAPHFATTFAGNVPSEVDDEGQSKMLKVSQSLLDNPARSWKTVKVDGSP